MSGGERPVPTSAKALSILLALLPPLRAAWIVFTVGENNLSNDYLFRVPLVAAMLDGKATLGIFLRYAWNGGGHSMLALAPISWLDARFFAWDVRVELAVGLAAVAATLVLVAGTLAPRLRWTLLPLLSLLLFSTTKITSFTFGESSLQMGLAPLGVAMAAFGFRSERESPLALGGWAAAGGVLASWSWGGGIVVWPVLFVAFAVRREKRAAAWALLATGAVVGLAQYVWLFRSGMSGAPPAAPSWVAKARLALDVLGRPLSNGLLEMGPRPRCQLVGAAGLLLAATAVILLRSSLRARISSLILVAWAALVAAEIALARTAVAPWYAAPMALFWVGLVSLLGAAPRLLRGAGILAVALLTLRVQPTWEDKSFYLPSRAPASAACLREYRTAPEACHALVFQWGDAGRLSELAELGEPLEKRGLSVFGPRRTYLLQGDATLGRVTPSGGAFLSRDGKTHGDLADFRRLDLVLPPGAVVTWRVDVPAGAVRATFETRVLGGASDAAAKASVTVDGRDAASARLAAPAGPALDLAPFAGKAVTLRLEGGTAPVVLEAPRILLRLRAG